MILILNSLSDAMPEGKYKGFTVKEIVEHDPEYLDSRNIDNAVNTKTNITFIFHSEIKEAIRNQLFISK